MFVRARPANPHELEPNNASDVAAITEERSSSTLKGTFACNGTENTIHVSRNDPESNMPSSSCTFQFDKVLNERTSQATVFEQVREYVDDALSGKDSCVFAYGQTASGKSYTVSTIVIICII